MLTNSDAKVAGQVVEHEWLEVMRQMRTGGLEKQAYWNAFFFKKISELEKAHQESNKIVAQLQLELQEVKKQLEEEQKLSAQYAKRFLSYDEFVKNKS